MGFARPRLAGDGLHPILNLELFLLEGGLRDLLFIAQDRLAGRGDEPAVVLVVLLIQMAVLLALCEETVAERKRVLGHRHLRGRVDVRRRQHGRSGLRVRGGSAPRRQVSTRPAGIQGSARGRLRWGGNSSSDADARSGSRESSRAGGRASCSPAPRGAPTAPPGASPARARSPAAAAPAPAPAGRARWRGWGCAAR